MQRTKILNLTFEKFFVIIILRKEERGEIVIGRNKI